MNRLESESESESESDGLLVGEAGREEEGMVVVVIDDGRWVRCSRKLMMTGRIGWEGNKASCVDLHACAAACLHRFLDE